MVHGWINIIIHKNEKKGFKTSQNWNDSSHSIWMIAKSKEIKADGRGLLRKLERICSWVYVSKQYISSLSCRHQIVSQKWPEIKVLHRIVEMGNKVC